MLKKTNSSQHRKCRRCRKMKHIKRFSTKDNCNVCSNIPVFTHSKLTDEEIEIRREEVRKSKWYDQFSDEDDGDSDIYQFI